MTALAATLVHAGTKPLAGLFRLGHLMSALATEMRVRRALRDVSTLDDAALNDIGLDRGGIEDAVRHGRR